MSKVSQFMTMNLRTHPTVTREVFDVTGAGDTILASLGFALACDYGILIMQSSFLTWRQAL